MAPRTAFLLLALLGAVVCLQGVVHAEDASISVAGSAVEKSLDEQRHSEAFPEAEVDSFDEAAEDLESESGTEVADVDGEEVEGDDPSSAHLSARILLEGASKKKCWNKHHCKKHFKQPGCCKEKCVNLASDNKHCGKCGRWCNVKKGYHCRSGKCHKLKKQSRLSQCGKHKQCKNGLTCCKPGKCVNPKTDCDHCGKCGKGCGHGKVCCKGKCISVQHDPRNCGACGKFCGFGKKCCNGYCKNVFGNDKHHCGACGKKCDTKCRFGICGYGH